MARVQGYRAEIILVLFTMIVGVLGFWGVYVGERADAQPHHHLHVATTFSWMALLLIQLLLLRHAHRADHRRIGLAAVIAAPALFASTALLTVLSAERGLASGEGDFLLVANILGTLWLGALLMLAFLFRKRRKLHGAFLMSTLIQFLGPALFFTMIAWIPQFRIDGPDTLYRLAYVGMAGQGIMLLIVLVFFFRGHRNNWPYLLSGASYPLAEALKAWLTREQLIDPLLSLTAGLNAGWTFAVAFSALLTGIAYCLRGGLSRLVRGAAGPRALPSH